MSYVRRSLPVVLLTALVVSLLGSSSSAGRAMDATPTYGPALWTERRGTFSGFPFERIDMVMGGLDLVFEDLVLPGNAGMDLRIHRKVGQAGHGVFLAGVPVKISPPYYHNEETQYYKPVMVFGDGSTEVLEPESSSISEDLFVASNFWRYQHSTRTLKMSNGWTATYTTGPIATDVHRLVEVHDSFGNSIIPTWEVVDGSGGLKRMASVRQVIGSQERLVSFTYPAGWTPGSTINPFAPTDMSYNDGNTTRHWTYTRDANTGSTTATPPDGGTWTFTSSPTQLTVTLPSGGVIQYAFESQSFPDLQTTRPVVRSRTVSDGRGATGTWNFTYQTPALANEDAVSQVSSPSGRATEYRHKFGPDRWSLSRRTLSHNSVEVSRVEVDYEPRSFGTTHSRGDRLVPVQVRKFEGGKTYTTTYGYRGNDAGGQFSDRHRPETIAEVGDLTRTTTRAFDYSFSTALASYSPLASETVNVNGQMATVAAEYNDATGFQESLNQAGLITQFGHDGSGNRVYQNDAAAHFTSNPSSWGTPATLSTPETTIQRDINPDGTVRGELRGGAWTYLGYDGRGRLKEVVPPEGATTITSYASDGTSMTVSRDGSWTRTDFDGLGRAIGTEDSEGVRTKTAYDIEGRKTYQSYAFVGSGDTGDSFTYDALGRLSRIDHVGGSAVVYTYVGTVVTITDENGHSTIQSWQAFGDPGSARLASVVDADGKLWQYSYNVFGSLTRVDPPEGPARIWNYNSANQLEWDTQPESGTTTYQYWPDGLLKSKTDALSRTTTYNYDGDHRLRQVVGPTGSGDDLSFDYDALGNRKRATSSAMDSFFTFDAANLLRVREDHIDGQVFFTRFDYDARNNLKVLTYPSGRTVRYDYDSADRVIKVYSDSMVYADGINYYPSGAIESYTLGNDKQYVLTLDDRKRPWTLTDGPVNLTYFYDPVGNVSSLTDHATSTTHGFTYDVLDRLWTVSGPFATAFTYDAQGNRKTKGAGPTLVNYAYNESTNRLTSATSPLGLPETGTFHYDNVGNMTCDRWTGTTCDPAGGSFTYNSRNQMLSATLNSNSTSYSYDGDGLRAMKRSASGTQYLIHGPGSQLLAEYASMFAKVAPASGLSTSNPTVSLRWTPAPGASGYIVCYDTTNNSSCEAGNWVWVGNTTHHVITDLSPGTYYWMVVASVNGQFIDSDNGSWWSVTIAPGGFAKLGPASGLSGLGSNVLVQFTALPDSGYWVCWDTTDNDSCDAAWWPNGGATSRWLEGLTPGTYYWQARAQTPSGIVDADGNDWWSFTVSGAGTFMKLGPANGITGLTSDVVLQWASVPDSGYQVCWDTSDNNQCDTAWWPNGGGTTRTLAGLAPGTYFWQARVQTGATLTEADGNTWWTFTVGTPEIVFGKEVPGHGAIVRTNAVTLRWNHAANAQFYEVCMDAVDNRICDTQWLPAVMQTSKLLTGLTDGTYYWQVRAQTTTGTTEANAGVWWTLTVDAPDPIREYIYLGSKLLASLNLTTGQPAVSYYHTDVLGSVRATTNAAGTTTTQHDYKPFGEGNTVMTGDPRRFTGKERDAETGFDYFDARYYRNMWGRFTTIDPAQASGSVFDPQGWNAYAYARNNPLKFVDPTGREYLVNMQCSGCKDFGLTNDEFDRLRANPGPGVFFLSATTMVAPFGIGPKDRRRTA